MPIYIWKLKFFQRKFFPENCFNCYELFVWFETIVLAREILVESIIVKFWLTFSKGDYYEFNLLWLLERQDKAHQRLASR